MRDTTGEEISFRTGVRGLSDETIRFLWDHYPGILYLCHNDETRTVLFVSESICRLTGYEASEFVEGTLTLAELIHPEDRGPVLSEIRRALDEDCRYRLTYRLRTRRKEWRWVEEVGTGIRVDGKIEYLEGTLQDITSRKEREEALRASEEKWRTLVEHAPNNVAIIDPSGRILYMNRVEPGTKMDEVLGTTIFDWIVEDHHSIVRESIDKAIRTGEPVKYEVEVPLPRGRTWWATHLGLIGSDTESPKLMSISTEITEEKKTKEALAYAHAELEERVRSRTFELTQANQRLQAEIVERELVEDELRKAKELAESANRAKGEFIASMSHELRTPLTSILGFVGLLEGENHGELTEAQTEFVSTIRRNSEHLLSLINDILDVAKTEAGQAQLEKSVVDLDQLIRQCLEMISGRALEKGLEIAPSPTSLGQAVVDERKVRQIVLNLLGNACKFTPEGGTIGVTGVREPDRLLFSVWDTGIGIDPKHRDTVFDPFKQLDSGDSRKYPGTGLGLTLAREFVQMHQGEIWIDHKRKKGSRFFFTIPLS